MISVNNILVPIVSALGEPLFLTGIRQMKNFETKEHEGWVYGVVSPFKNFEKADVKVKGIEPTITLTNVEIQAANTAGNYIQVRFVNGICKLYTSYGDKVKETKPSFSADGIIIVPKQNDDELL